MRVTMRYLKADLKREYSEREKEEGEVEPVADPAAGRR